MGGAGHSYDLPRVKRGWLDDKRFCRRVRWLPIALSSAEYNSLDDDDKLSGRAAREMLHYGAECEGYYDNAKFMIQVG